MSNPYQTDRNEIQRSVSMPIAKAKVTEALSKPSDGGIHTVTVRVHGDEAPYEAPVLTPMLGSAFIPEVGDNVAVAFSAEDKPWVIGAWYPDDQVRAQLANLPDYEPGELVLGVPSNDSRIRIFRNGDIILTDENGQTVEFTDTGVVITDEDDQTIELTATGILIDDNQGNTIEVDTSDGSIRVNGGTKGVIKDISTTEDADGHVTSISITRSDDLKVPA